MKSNKVKKLLALALAGAMCIGTLTACGGSSGGSSSSGGASAPAAGDSSAPAASSGGGSGNLVMAWWGNQKRNEKTQQALDKYKELKGVSVEGQFYQWNDYWSKLATVAAAHSLPDLIQMDYTYIEQYTNNKQLLDLTPYIESGALDTKNIPENVLAMGKVGDGIYGIPAGVSGNCLFYNKTATDSAGITIKDNLSYDEFVAIAKEMKEKTGYRAAIYYSYAYFVEWSRAEGVPIVEAKVPVASADGYVPFFENIETALKEGWMLTPEYIDTSGVETSPLVYGSSPETMAWCLYNGTSNQLPAFQNAAPEGTEIALMTMPTSNTVKSNFLKPAMYFSISTDTKDPDAAVALLDYLINSEDANAILLGERGVPASTVVADSIKGMLSDVEQRSFAYVTDVITPNCSPINPPEPEGMSKFYDALTKIVERVSYGELDAKGAAEELYNAGIEIWGN